MTESKPDNEQSRSEFMSQIDCLSSKVIALYWQVGPDAAKPYADELASLIEDEPIERHLHMWIAIWMARGCMDKAVECGEIDLEDLYQDIAKEEAIQGQPADKEDVANLIDCLYLQADRYCSMNIKNAAFAKMCEAKVLSERYSVPLDNDSRTLWNKLRKTCQ